MPVDALVRAVADTEARFVTVTATAPRSREEMEVYLEKLMGALPEDCVVALGGTGIPSGLTETDRVRLPRTPAELISYARLHLI